VHRLPDISKGRAELASILRAQPCRRYFGGERYAAFAIFQLLIEDGIEQGAMGLDDVMDINGRSETHIEQAA
jgi:hypothetical protein